MIYTRQGDRGNTKLFTGQVVSKDSPIIEFIGLIDELSSMIGLCVSFLDDTEGNNDSDIVDFSPEIDILKDFQKDLRIIGAIASGSKLKFDTKTEVSNIEKTIDDYEKLLKPLDNFILPGGDIVASHIHLARAKSRQIERMAVSVNSKSLLTILPYLNRLSDLLFVIARYINYKLGFEE